MKFKILAILFSMTLILAGMSYAADDQSSSGTLTPPYATNASADKQNVVGQAVPQSLGAQAGESAKQLKETADETLSTGAMKVAESSKKVETEVQATVKTLQEQWDVLAKQLQEKTKQIQAQLQVQWQDFQKSFNKPQ